jgi:hypothetical protein
VTLIELTDEFDIRFVAIATKEIDVRARAFAMPPLVP